MVVNTAGLNLSGSLCPECGLVHPPIEGPCPVAKAQKEKNNPKIETPVSPTHNKEENSNENTNVVKSKKNIADLNNNITKMINNKLSELKFENDYVEDKFYKILNKTVIDNLKEFLNDYKQ